MKSGGLCDVDKSPSVVKDSPLACDCRHYGVSRNPKSAELNALDSGSTLRCARNDDVFKDDSQFFTSHRGGGIWAWAGLGDENQLSLALFQG